MEQRYKKIPNDERVSAKKRLRLAQIAFLPSEEEFDVVKLNNFALGFTIIGGFSGRFPE